MTNFFKDINEMSNVNATRTYLPLPPRERLRGTVRFFDAARGFGFIAPDNNGDDVFFGKVGLDLAGIDRFPYAGERLEFEIEQDRLGRPRAGQLEVID